MDRAEPRAALPRPLSAKTAAQGAPNVLETAPALDAQDVSWRTNEAVVTVERPNTCCHRPQLSPFSPQVEIMAEAKGSVEVYESSDGGSENPRKTHWQFSIGGQFVGSDNPHMAETIRLAVLNNKEVVVTYDADNGNTISQVKIILRIPPPGQDPPTRRRKSRTT